MLFPWIPHMTILMAILVMSIFDKMDIFDHFDIFGHMQYDHKYGHVGYPWKQHKNTSLLVKK